MQPGQELIQLVRAGFIMQGTTLWGFCRVNGLDANNARKSLLGKWNGKKAIALRERLIESAKVADLGTVQNATKVTTK